MFLKCKNVAPVVRFGRSGGKEPVLMNFWYDVTTTVSCFMH